MDKEKEKAKKIVERIMKVAEEKKFGSITVTYTVSQKKIVKAVVRDTQKIELLD